MAQQPPKKDRNSASSRQKRSHRVWGIMVGFGLCVIGTILMLQNYSSNPPLFNIGAGIWVIGAPTLLISAAMRDKLNPPRNGPARRP